MTSVNTNYAQVTEHQTNQKVKSNPKEEINIFEVKSKLGNIAKTEGDAAKIDTAKELQAVSDFVNEYSTKISSAVKRVLNAIVQKEVDFSTIKPVDKETQKRTEDFIARFQAEFPEPGDIAILDALGYTN